MTSFGLQVSLKGAALHGVRVICAEGYVPQWFTLVIVWEDVTACESSDFSLA